MRATQKRRRKALKLHLKRVLSGMSPVEIATWIARDARNSAERSAANSVLHNHVRPRRPAKLAELDRPIDGDGKAWQAWEQEYSRYQQTEEYRDFVSSDEAGLRMVHDLLAAAAAEHGPFHVQGFDGR